MDLSSLQQLVVPVTGEVYELNKNLTILVKTVEEFFTIEGILQKEGYNNAYKKTMQKIESLDSFIKEDEFKQVVESFEDKDAALDDYQTPLIEYLIKYPKIVAKNYFGVREIFTKEESVVYIVKLYNLKAQILDEFVFIDDYGFNKISRYFYGIELEFPSFTDKDSLLSFLKEKNLDVIYELLTLQSFTDEEIDDLYNFYQEDEKKASGNQTLIKNVRTKQYLSKLLKEKLDKAKEENAGIFSVSLLADEEINNRLGLIIKYMDAYIKQIAQLDSDTQSLLVENDIDVAINRELIQIKSFIKESQEKKDKIQESILTLDELKMKKDLQDKDERISFLQEYLKTIQQLLTLL